MLLQYKLNYDNVDITAMEALAVQSSDKKSGEETKQQSKKAIKIQKKTTKLI